MEISIETTEFRVCQSPLGPVVTDLATGERLKRLTLLRMFSDGKRAYLELEGRDLPKLESRVISADVTLGLHRLRVVDGWCRRVLQLPFVEMPDKWNSTSYTTDIGDLSGCPDVPAPADDECMEIRDVYDFVFTVDAYRRASIVLKLVEQSSLPDLLEAFGWRF